MANFSRVLLILATVLLGCSSGGSSGSKPSAQSGAGHCDDKCLKACAGDSDCDPSKSELCCDFGADGKACAAASACPRFCANDSKCDATNGEACLRATLASSQSVCLDPSKDNTIKLCSADTDCSADSLCCTIYKDSICLKPDQCPKACSTSGDCNNKNGEVCCTTLKLRDPALAAAGLCIDPAQVACPTACSMSSDCDTKSGELCCEGLCKKDCVKSCTTSADCSAQICCTAAAENSPWLHKQQKPGYPVASGPAAGGSSGNGGSGTGGSGGSGIGGSGASAGAHAGGSTSTGGSASSCETCSATLAAGDVVGANVCAGHSMTLLTALQGCVCTDSCTASCATFCTTGVRNNTCDGCITANCAGAYLACTGD